MRVQCVAVCCSVLQCVAACDIRVAVCCSILQCVAVRCKCDMKIRVDMHQICEEPCLLQRVAVCGVAVCCSVTCVLQCVVVCNTRVEMHAIVWCSVVQCDAV